MRLIWQWQQANKDCCICSDLSALPTETSDMINRENQLKIIYMKKFIDSINQDLHEKKLLADKVGVYLCLAIVCPWLDFGHPPQCPHIV